MRIARSFLTPALLLFCLLLAPGGARAAGPAASGTYQFTLGADRSLKFLQFDAQTLADGTSTGKISFQDDFSTPDQDVDGTGKPSGGFKGFFITADVDGLTVSGNRAILSGTVRDSNLTEMLGQRVLLTVEDNGDNTRVPDRLTWGVYQPVVRDWKPSDAELKDDPGVGLRWWATDAEVKDDRGYQMPRDESFNTQTYPLGAYVYESTVEGTGDIVVTP